MKFLYLAAGKNNSYLDSNKDIPKCLTNYSKHETIFDKILSNLKIAGIDKIYVVGGYKILSIIKKYPLLKYFFNEYWKVTKSLFSLQIAKSEFDDDLIISYSDIVYNNKVIKELNFSESDITIIIDSNWKNRYSGRKSKNLVDAEKVVLEKSGKVRIDKNHKKNENVIGEFIGVFRVNRSVSNKLEHIISDILRKNKMSSVCDLINHLQNQFSISFIDIFGEWAELDSQEDLLNFKFGTKADTLKSLEKKVKHSNILNQYKFTVDEFEKNPNKIITKIQSSISSNKIVIRSSALNEDTQQSSMAGNYESILNVNRNDKQSIYDSCEIVIKSYLKDNQEKIGMNQVLVQPQLENVNLSGVVFTKDLETSAPYYIINYDVSNKTDTITSGANGEIYTYIHYKFSANLPKNKTLRILINAVKEIESITRQSSLDIEFAVVKNKIYIFQVRPIASQKDEVKVFEQDIKKELDSINNFIKTNKKPPPKILGDYNIYGVMPDWNPAEIIGIKPYPLSFDLYKYLITDHVWSKTRSILGYRDIDYHPGMYSLSGQPYIDVRMSFNTFTPKSINEKTARKLINYYLLKLERKPEFHDKVEFEIAITCFDFDFESKMNELEKNGFSKNELNEIATSFKNLTRDVINEKKISIDSQLQKNKILNEKREKIKKSSLPLQTKVVKLLEDCKKYGTEPFAILARFGFFGSILMKSLLKIKLISDKEYNDFFNSIRTVATDFVYDTNRININGFNKENFLKKYGHLRPGTYDINSKSYMENFNNYINTNNIKKHNQIISKEYKFSLKTKKNIQSLIDKLELEISVDSMLLFVKKATEAREFSKFEFSKNLSLAIDYMIQLGDDFGISRTDFAFCNLNSILSLLNGSVSSNISNEIFNQIEYNKKKHLLTCALKLPELIFSPKDIYGFYYENSKPNYITQLCIEGEIACLSDDEIDIAEKIVVIENADPGYDWVFSHKIKGLITKFGGAASHMAIRCAEFGLPAAIGCGAKFFDELNNGDFIQLDCLNQRINKL